MVKNSNNILGGTQKLPNSVDTLIGGSSKGRAPTKAGGPNPRDFDSYQEYLNALRVFEDGPRQRDFDSEQDFINAGGLRKDANELPASLADPDFDPAKAILGDDVGLIDPLAAPTEDSASVERARRKALIKAGLRSGRLSTILSDKSY